MKKILFVFLLMTASIGFTQQTVDVNDVSYLWPPVLLKSQMANTISLSEVMPESAFKDLLEFAKKNKLSQNSGADQFQNWHIVAMRVDPCAPKNKRVEANLESCQQEVRLVAQPFAFGKNTVEYFDFSLHLIYRLSEGHPQDAEKFSDLWKKLLDLKAANALKGISTQGVPLRVHPAFKIQEFQQNLKQVITQVATPASLKKATFIGAENAAGPWLFFQGLVINGRYEPEADSNLGGQAFGHLTPELPAAGGILDPLPTNSNWPFKEDGGFGTSVLDLFSPGNVDLNAPAQLTNSMPSQVIRIKDIPSALDNPRITDRTNTDCFSCHTSMSRALLMNIDPESSAQRFRPENTKVTLTNVLANKSMTNFRAFGWFGSKPVVTNRVIFESAQVIEMLEKYVRADKLKLKNQ